MATSKVLWSGICVLALALAVAGGCGRDKGSGPDDNLPGAFGVELENFANKHDIEGGVTITRSFCGGASGDYQVTGMDVVGEWIEVSLHVDASATYEAHLSYQAESIPVQIAMTIEGCGNPATVVNFTLEHYDGIG
jgi:hypothetical protein